MDVVYFEFSMVFDTVSHIILVVKLSDDLDEQIECSSSINVKTMQSTVGILDHPGKKKTPSSSEFRNKLKEATCP